jgi:hypothetical protein
LRFPLPYVPTASYRGGRGFGASREAVRAGLRHAANDLIAPKGTPVLAMDDGVVLSDPYPFFRGTFAFEIRHPAFIARYCEIDPATEVRGGDKVAAGQVIAYVGDQPGADMLHIEFFRGTASGLLSTGPGKAPPYDRRRDVFDGTKLLDLTQRSATHLEGASNWRMSMDSDGRKFLAPMDLRDI